MPAKKKLHWTQTAEGRKILSLRGKQPRTKKSSLISDQDEITQIAYTLGWLEGWAKKAYPVIKRSRQLAATPMGQLILSLKGR